MDIGTPAAIVWLVDTIPLSHANTVQSFQAIARSQMSVENEGLRWRFVRARFDSLPRISM